MPAAIEIGTVITNASRASLPERNRAGKMMFFTRPPLRYEWPKSRVNRRRIDVAYWLISGRSAPRAWLYLATSSFAANAPRTRRPGSPGNTFTTRNTIVARSHRVTTADAKRLSKNRPMVPLPECCRNLYESCGHQARGTPPHGDAPRGRTRLLVSSRSGREAGLVAVEVAEPGG